MFPAQRKFLSATNTLSISAGGTIDLGCLDAVGAALSRQGLWAQSVAAKDARWSLADFLCSRPDCAALLRDPAILNCGCAMCISCLPQASEPCPRCGAISVTQPKPCTKVRSLPPTKNPFPSQIATPHGLKSAPPRAMQHGAC